MSGYSVVVSFETGAENGSTLWVTDKTSSGFTIHCKNGAGTDETTGVDWIAIPNH
jgi:hypothetical protein